MSFHDKVNGLTVIVPVYNEVKTVEKALISLVSVIRDIDSFKTEVIVVESNSTDGTREKILNLKKSLGFNLILQDIPLGKGNAVRQALNSCNNQWILIFDADDEYDVNDIPNLISVITDDKRLFIIGSRNVDTRMIRKMKSHKVRSVIMNFAHHFFAFLINTTGGSKLKDPFSMYKIFHQELFKDVSLIADKFDFDWELVIKAGRLGANFKEIPIKYDSRDFTEGKKIRFFRDPINWIFAWVKFSFGRI